MEFLDSEAVERLLAQPPAQSVVAVGSSTTAVSVGVLRPNAPQRRTTATATPTPTPTPSQRRQVRQLEDILDGDANQQEADEPPHSPVDVDMTNTQDGDDDGELQHEPAILNAADVLLRDVGLGQTDANDQPSTNDDDLVAEWSETPPTAWLPPQDLLPSTVSSSGEVAELSEGITSLVLHADSTAITATIMTEVDTLQELPQTDATDREILRAVEAADQDSMQSAPTQIIRKILAVARPSAWTAPTPTPSTSTSWTKPSSSSVLTDQINPWVAVPKEKRSSLSAASELHSGMRTLFALRPDRPMTDESDIDDITVDDLIV